MWLRLMFLMSCGGMVFALNGFADTLPQQTKFTPLTGGGSASIGAKVPAAPPVTYTTVIKLGPMRTWTNQDGKPLSAELISWPIPGALSADQNVDTVAFDIVRQGKVRLRQGKQTWTLDVTKLSAADQEHVQHTEAAVLRKRSAPSPIPPTK
jgi:hypothetical protein